MGGVATPPPPAEAADVTAAVADVPADATAAVSSPLGYTHTHTHEFYINTAFHPDPHYKDGLTTDVVYSSLFLHAIHTT